MFFDHLDLFRISDFEFVILFIHGVLRAFARGLMLIREYFTSEIISDRG